MGSFATLLLLQLQLLLCHCCMCIVVGVVCVLMDATTPMHYARRHTVPTIVAGTAATACVACAWHTWTNTTRNIVHAALTQQQLQQQLQQ